MQSKINIPIYVTQYSSAPHLLQGTSLNPGGSVISAIMSTGKKK